MSHLVMRIERFNGFALLREVFTFDPPSYSRQADDLAIAVLDRMCRAVVGASWRPLSICFRYQHPPASELPVYKRLFACPAEFGSEFDGILVDGPLLDTPNSRSEPALALRAQADWRDG